MRKCKQINCIFLRIKQGCRKCSFCSAEPFIVADDCPTCFNCENIPNSCRWGDEDTDIDNKQTEKEKPIEIKAK